MHLASTRAFCDRCEPLDLTHAKGHHEMTISLHDASVASYLQAVTAIGNCLDKGLAYFREHGIDPEEVVETRLIADMRPFRFQVQSIAYHSVGALNSLRAGHFQPPVDRPEQDYAALQALIAETRATLQQQTPDEVNALSGKDLLFKGSTLRTYTAESFLLSFALPNFYFHVTTTYDILRMKGVPVGKRDYIGTPRLKG